MEVVWSNDNHRDDRSYFRFVFSAIGCGKRLHYRAECWNSLPNTCPRIAPAISKNTRKMPCFSIPRVQLSSFKIGLNHSIVGQFFKAFWQQASNTNFTLAQSLTKLTVNPLMTSRGLVSHSFLRAKRLLQSLLPAVMKSVPKLLRNLLLQVKKLADILQTMYSLELDQMSAACQLQQSKRVNPEGCSWALRKTIQSLGLMSIRVHCSV